MDFLASLRFFSLLMKLAGQGKTKVNTVLLKRKGKKTSIKTICGEQSRQHVTDRLRNTDDSGSVEINPLGLTPLT